MAASITLFGCALPAKDGTPSEAASEPGSDATGVREAIASAFKELGGVNGLVEWAKSGGDAKKAFYIQLWLKIMAAEEKETGDHRPLEEIRMTVVDPGA